MELRGRLHGERGEPLAPLRQRPHVYGHPHRHGRPRRDRCRVPRRNAHRAAGRDRRTGPERVGRFALHAGPGVVHRSGPRRAMDRDHRLGRRYVAKHVHNAERGDDQRHALVYGRRAHPVHPTVQDSAGRVTLRDTLVILSLGANPSGDSLRGKKQVRSVNGVATFADLRLDKAASGYTLTAAAPKLDADTSAAFSVMPAPATVLAFTVQPSATMQDSAITPPVQVTAYDSLGNKATNFSGPIRVALGADGSVSQDATLAGAPNPATAVAGVATFPNLRINRAGVDYTLTAAFGSATPVATSAAFNITPGPPPPPPPPTHLGFTQEPQTDRKSVV